MPQVALPVQPNERPLLDSRRAGRACSAAAPGQGTYPGTYRYRYGRGRRTMVLDNMTRSVGLGEDLIL